MSAPTYTYTLLAAAIFGQTLAISAEPESPKIPRPSSFNAEKVLRNPFERIDAKALAERNSTVAAAGPKTEDLASYFSLSAVCIDRLSIAVINKKAFAESEWFKVKLPDKTLRVQLQKVREASVEINCEGTIVTVPLVRQLPTSQEPSE